jgi:phage major head subunit gpT-like protein
MMVSGSFSRLLAPGLDKVFHTAYNEAPEMWTNFFNLERSDKAYEEHFSYAGFEQFQPYDELEDIELRNAKPGFITKYVHRKWGLGYQLSRELVEDNLYSGVIEQFPAHLARAARATKESVAATIFNLGFSTTQPGGDSKPLFATDHPLAGTGGGTGSNTFSTPQTLSHAALKDAIIQLKRTKADDDIFSPITPAILLVPDQLEFAALEILRTDRMPYTDENTINVLRDSNLRVVSWSYLTDEDNWFLLAPKPQTMLYYFERWPLRQIMEDKELNQSMVHLAYERYSFGFSDWRGVFGVRGS